MSEPSSGVPGEIADADVEEPTPRGARHDLELEVDEEKIEAWDEVKGDYQVEPGGEPVPNSMDGRPRPRTQTTPRPTPPTTRPKAPTTGTTPLPEVGRR